nr:MAG TPA: hypothetical protein [Bacteriophage sp.]
MHHFSRYFEVTRIKLRDLSAFVLSSKIKRFNQVLIFGLYDVPIIL